ncbi:PPOX class F420-dependent oxidoreductase [Streptomyces sp. NPDC048291]|uniref:PPOX class F420-dependent oxidoreductase n=1 Tax=Streptomyces sp. NPDC048291 TaxID=3365530 RepID=UPI00371FE7CC
MRASGQNALWEIVVNAREGVLATIGPDGRPHLSNVYYVPDDGPGDGPRTIHISTTSDRAKGSNLLRDPRAVLHVHGPDFFNFAVVEGTVSLGPATAPGEPAIDQLYAVNTVFNGAAERPAFDHRMIRDRRMVVRIQVTNLYGLVHRSVRRRDTPESSTGQTD